MFWRLAIYNGERNAMKKLFLLLPLLLLLAHCAPAPVAPPTPDVGWMVSATLTAVASDASTLAAPSGGIEGRLAYPAESSPALRIVAFQVATGQYYVVETTAGQTFYRLEGLPEGKYNVVAYTLGSEGVAAGLAGGYTQAVLCGMGPECTEHGLVDVIVFEGEITPGVDILDWFQPNFPPMP